MFCAISPMLMAQTPTKPESAAAVREPIQVREPIRIPVVALPAPEVLKAWAKTMHHTPAPKAGCFHAEYPSAQWVEVQCAPPNGWRPDLYQRLKKKRGSGELVGGAGGDIIAEAPTGLLFSNVEGSFPTENGVTSETDSSGIHAGANEYTLQLNTNFSNSAIGLCAGFPSCRTIVQYVLSTNAPISLTDGAPTNQTQIFIEPTLYNYGNDPTGTAPTNICPSGWTDFGYIGPGDYCAINLPSVVINWNPPLNLGQLPITDLADLTLSGSATAGGNDAVTATYHGVASMAATAPDSFTDISSVWNNAEFNVFGNAGSSQAVFNGPTSPTSNNGSTLVVQSAVTYTNGSTAAPNCVSTGGPTLETNNLTLATAPGSTTPTCCAYSGATPGIQGTSPGIQFVESNNPNEWAMCPAPITWGEPHITTVDGTIYNFQGAGEYITLLDPDGTEVQVRQSPIPTDGADDYVPNQPAKYQDDGLKSCLSGNTAVAARVGTHRVTYEPCFGGGACNNYGLQLRVDGKVATQGSNWGDGGSVEITSDGVEVQFPDGKILNVSGSLPLLNVLFSGVGVASKSAGSSVSGLAGFVPDKNWLPRLPNGAALGSMPASMHDRYVTLNQKFGNAWRVTNSNSLFDYAPGKSTATFTNTAWPVENPKSCSVPNQKTMPHISVAAAEEACKSITNATLHSSCVFDVKMTGITRFAETYAINERIHTKLAPKPILIRPVITEMK